MQNNSAPTTDTEEKNGQTAQVEEPEVIQPESPVRNFHNKLMRDQRYGILSGIPEDPNVFEKAFANPDYQKGLHRYMLNEQLKGNVNGIPRDKEDFVNKFQYQPPIPLSEAPARPAAEEEYVPADSLNIDNPNNAAQQVVNAAEQDTFDMDLLDNPGLSPEVKQLMNEQKSFNLDQINIVAGAGESLRKRYRAIQDEQERLWSLGFTTGMDDEEREYYDKLKAESNGVMQNIMRSYTTLQGELDRVRQLQRNMKEAQAPPSSSFAPSGSSFAVNTRVQSQAIVNATLPDEKKEQYEELDAYAQKIEEAIDKVQPSGRMRFQHAANTFMRTFATDIPAGMLEGMAVLSAELEQRTKSMEVVHKLLGGDPEKDKAVSEYALFEYGQKLREFGARQFPGDPTLQQEFVDTMVPAAAGSMIGYALGGLSSKVIGASSTAFTTMAATTGGMSQMYTEAIAYGASESDAQLSARWGSIFGGIQALPVMRLLDRFDKASGGQLKMSLSKVLKDGFKGGLEEAFVEMAGQAGFDQIARNVYDSERDTLESLRQINESGGAGFIGGFLANIIFAAAGARRGAARRTSNPNPADGTDGADGADGADGTPPTPPTEGSQPVRKIDNGRSITIDEVDGTPQEKIADLQQQRDTLQDVMETNPDFDPELMNATIEMIDNRIQELSGNQTETSQPGQNALPPGPQPAGLLPPASQQVQEGNQAKRNNFQSQGTLGDAVGTRVSYGSYNGTLTVDGEGAFVVETDNGTLVEVADSQKDSTIPLENVGITRSYASTQSFTLTDPGTGQFEVESVDPETGQTTTENFTFENSNTNEAGEVVSVTMRNSRGEQRTFRNPNTVEQVTWDMFFQNNENNIAALEEELSDAPQDPAAIEANEEVEAVPAPQTYRLDDNDPRLDPIFEALDNDAPLTQQQQQEGLEWISDKTDEIIDANPENATDLISQLEQFENEIVNYGNITEQTSNLEGEGIVNQNENEVPVNDTGQPVENVTPVEGEAEPAGQTPTTSATESGRVDPANKAQGRENAITVMDGKYDMYYDDNGNIVMYNIDKGRPVGRTSPNWKQAESEFHAKRWESEPRLDLEQVPEDEYNRKGLAGVVRDYSNNLLDYIDALSDLVRNGLHKEARSEARQMFYNMARKNQFTPAQIAAVFPGWWQDNFVWMRWNVAKRPQPDSPDVVAQIINDRLGTDLEVEDILQFYIDYWEAGEAAINAEFTSEEALDLQAAIEDKLPGFTGGKFDLSWLEQMQKQADLQWANATESDLEAADNLMNNPDFDAEAILDENGDVNYDQVLEEFNKLAENDPEYEAYMRGEVTPEEINRLQNEQNDNQPQQLQDSPPQDSQNASNEAPESAESFARQQVTSDLEVAQAEFKAADEAYNAKKRQLDNEIQRDTENLFGERQTEQDNALFDERVDISQRDLALKPLLDRRNAAAQRVNQLYAELQNMGDQADPNLFDQQNEPQTRSEELAARRQEIEAELDQLARDMYSEGQGRLSMGIDPKMIAQSVRFIAKGLELGYVRFQQFADFIINQYGPDYWNNIFDSFKAAYISQMNRRGNPNNEDLESLQQASADAFINNESETTGDGNDSPPNGPTIIEPETNPASEPDPAYSSAKVPGIFSKFGYEGFRRVFEGTAELLSRTPGLESVGNAIRNMYDLEASYQGEIAKRLESAMQQAFGTGINEFFSSPINFFKSYISGSKVEQEFQVWAEAFDRGTPEEADAAYNNASPEVQALADAWYELAVWTGNKMRDAGVEVYDPVQGKYRPIGNVARFWPRTLKPKYQKAIDDPSKYPAVMNEIADMLIEAGVIDNRSEVKKYIATQKKRPAAATGDFYANIEMGRTEGFPKEMYSHNLRVGLEYLYRWAERMSQIETMGQRHKEGGDLIDSILAEGEVTDQETKDYLRTVQAVIYKSRATNKGAKFAAMANQIATATMLSNPATASLNFIGGMSLNNMSYGVDAVKAYVDLLRDPAARDYAIELGVLNNDYLRLLSDTDGISPSFMNTGTSILLRIGGYTGTERMIRMHALLSSKRRLERAVDVWTQSGLESKEGRKLAVWFQRNGFDPYQLLDEHNAGERTDSGFITGPEIDRFIRYGVNLTQGSYKLDQVPLWADTGLGRFFFKYWKFSTQLSRMFQKNAMEPFIKSLTLPAGDSMEVRNPQTGEMETTQYPRSQAMIDMMKYLGFSAFGGLILTELRESIFGYQRVGPDHDELEKALQDEETGKAVAIGMEMMFEALISLGGIGIIQYPYLWARDFSERKRTYDPTDPAGLAVAKEWSGYFIRLTDAGWDRKDFENTVARTISLYRTGKRAALYGMNAMGSEMDMARLEGRKREHAYARRIARRFAQENDIVPPRIAPGAFGATENTKYTRDVVDAIMIGDKATAAGIIKKRLDEVIENSTTVGEAKDEARKLMLSFKTSVRNRQPIFVRGGSGEETRIEVLKWAEENLTPGRVKKLKEIDESYRNTAAELGLINLESPIDVFERNIQEKQDNRPLTDGAKWLIYQNLNIEIDKFLEEPN